MLRALILAAVCLGGRSAGVDTKLGYVTADDSNFEGHEGDFFKFVSRPDIQAPRWEVNVHEPEQVSPGYWFVAPYEHTFRPAPLPAWVGPHIYDKTGDLVWSGASMFHGSDSYDFRMSEFGDDKLMTFEYRETYEAVFMDGNYKVKRKGKIGESLLDLNMHDLNIIEGGTRALVLTKSRGKATEQASWDVGMKEGQCKAAFDGFKVLNITKDEWETIFEWSAFDHVPLTESTYMDGEIEVRCGSGWDYLHLNSVSKCPDGNYLLSARHSDTIYNIDGKDGSILWRLGGRHSDFQQDFNFSRQHDIRCRKQDGGNYTISFLDNGKGHDDNNATHEYSRGLVVELDTDATPKTATVKQEYPHPSKGYSTSRGNLQTLENGNVFMGWSDRCLHSEHAPNGEVLMEARLVPEFLGTYRSYKYPFAGHPTQPPDVHSEVFADQGGVSGALTTHVYVSWNGATDVAEWRLYRSDSSAKNKELLATVKRESFETLLTAEGFVSYVVVEAVDAWDHVLVHGRSGVVMTVHPADWVTDKDPKGLTAPGSGQPLTVQAAAVEEEPTHRSASTPLILTFLAGFFSMALLLAVAWILSKALKNKKLLSKLPLRKAQVDYLPLAESEKEADAKDFTPASVLRTRERSETKATSVAPLPLHKSMHRRGDSIQRTGWPMPPTP